MMMGLRGRLISRAAALVSLATASACGGTAFVRQGCSADLRRIAQAAMRRRVKMGSLDLDTFEGMRKGGHHGEVIVPGKSDESRLYLMITGKCSRHAAERQEAGRW